MTDLPQKKEATLFIRLEKKDKKALSWLACQDSVSISDIARKFIKKGIDSEYPRKN